MSEDFRTPLSRVDRSSIYEVCKETPDLSSTRSYVHTCAYTTSYSTTAECIFSLHRVVSKIVYMLGNRINLKFREIEIIASYLLGMTITRKEN